MSRKRGIPNGVKVGPLVYDITLDDNAHLRAEHGAGHGLMGQTSHISLVITLKPDMAPDMVKATLIHEILHTLFYAAGSPVGDDKEERLIRALEAPLYALLVDNPGLLAYLLDE
jgi:hypothetical protein